MSIYISASMINDFIKCNKMVYYRINHPELQISNREMTIGNIVHKAIELYWDNPITANIHINSQLMMTLPDDKSALKFAEDCMQTYFHNFKQYLTDKDDVEKRFKIPWGKDIFIVGKMDRISNQSVFDWKTARTPLKDVSGDPQFILYNWAYKCLYGHSPAAVYYAALTTGNLVMYKHDKVAESVLLGYIIPQLITAIKTKDYIPNGLFRKACYRCAYSESCLKELAHELDSFSSS